MILAVLPAKRFATPQKQLATLYGVEASGIRKILIGYMFKKSLKTKR